jgi:hypothetical protein
VVAHNHVDPNLNSSSSSFQIEAILAMFFGKSSRLIKCELLAENH